MNRIYGWVSLLIVCSVPIGVLAGSHSFAMVSVFIKGKTPFPEYSLTVMLDDITVGYFSSETKTLVSRSFDEAQEDDGVLDPSEVETISSYLHADHEYRYYYAKNVFNLTEYIHVQQRLVVCELMDNDKYGPMITKTAIGGSTMDELYYYEGKYTYQNDLNLTAEQLKPRLDLTVWRHGNIYYPTMIKTLRGYLNKRSHQVKRKGEIFNYESLFVNTPLQKCWDSKTSPFTSAVVKPRVRLIPRRHSVSGWDGVTCLATGFYPRHINLTILRNGHPVPEHLITGGELLPNGDGTYQMRRSVQLSTEELKKQNFTCTVTHLSLDNKMDVYLDFDPGEPIVPIFGWVLAALFSVCVMAAVLWITCMIKRRAFGLQRYSSASTKEEEIAMDGTKD